MYYFGSTDQTTNFKITNPRFQIVSDKKAITNKQNRLNSETCSIGQKFLKARIRSLLVVGSDEQDTLLGFDSYIVAKLMHYFYLGVSIFRLFPIISISQKFFSFFFLTLEKIGIDEKVICYHNISN